MAETDPRRISDPDPATKLILSAIQSALHTVIVDGTRYASDLKGTEKIIERNEEHLKREPNNQKFIEERQRKIAFRDECLNQIKNISHRVAQQLYQVFQQSFSEASKAHSSQAAPPSGQQSPDPPSNKELETLASHTKILKKQIKTNEEEVERLRGEHRQMIESLQQQLAVQAEEIRIIKQLIQPSNPTPQSRRVLAPDAMAIDGETSPKEESPNPSTVRRSFPASFPQIIVHRHQEAINRMIVEITNLKAEVVATLTEEIPGNLQRSVRMMQQDVQSALQTTNTHYLKHLTDLVRDLVGDFETRLGTLESLARRIPSTIHPKPTDRQPLIQMRAASAAPAYHPISKPTPTSTTKDPRLLYRQSVATAQSSEIRPSTESNSPIDCRPQ